MIMRKTLLLTPIVLLSHLNTHASTHIIFDFEEPFALFKEIEHSMKKTRRALQSMFNELTVNIKEENDNTAIVEIKGIKAGKLASTLSDDHKSLTIIGDTQKVFISFEDHFVQVETQQEEKDDNNASGHSYSSSRTSVGNMLSSLIKITHPDDVKISFDPNTNTMYVSFPLEGKKKTGTTIPIHTIKTLPEETTSVNTSADTKSSEITESTLTK